MVDKDSNGIYQIDVRCVVYIIIYIYAIYIFGKEGVSACYVCLPEGTRVSSFVALT